jgi:energy-coupling factor transport system ATP-binding protein
MVREDSMKQEDQDLKKDNQDVLFQIDHVSHVFQTEDGKKFEALHDITASIKKGEFVAVIGTNGSGKSTLARHLNALLLPSDGNIYVEGMNTQDPDSIWKIRQKVGMVFQNPDNQLVAAIVEEDVAFGPENLGVPPAEIRRRVEACLKRVGMLEYREQSPSKLSGGQKQRVAIAGILAMKPDCIVLDEPTAMLDPRGRKEVMDTVQDLNQNEGMTIVLITHFMEEAVKADRILVVEHGHLIMDGTPREIFSQTKKILEMGLDVPIPTYLSYGLKEKGLPIQENTMTNQELAEALWPFVSKT